ncbi:Uncharacterised protein [Flavonifractor plautii]|uniref:Uncharacterized protein n=1 Tax=Flavonifractor plautii TaxID=292800 RepID=A0A174PJ19_FLAPL|nr:Uncharacterised protein [Flavonifractor plautii]
MDNLVVRDNGGQLLRDGIRKINYSIRCKSERIRPVCFYDTILYNNRIRCIGFCLSKRTIYSR